MTHTADNGTDVATLGGGCFWCIEAVFQHVQGVASVESGYMGGKHPDPSYEAICTGVTGHAEVVQVTFDPTVIDYRAVLEIFFAVHDPTTLNRQGNDAGTQYRSVIFIIPLNRPPRQKTSWPPSPRTVFDSPIVTEVSPAQTFYAAEAYHQEYFVRNPAQPYCAYLIAPKLAKFRQQFTSRLKTVS